MSVNRVGNNLFIKPYEQYEVKSYAQNGVDNPIFQNQSQADTFQKTAQNYQENETVDITSLKQDLEKTKSKQGILGKLWDGFKNLTGIGAGSSKAEQAIEDYEIGLISQEEMQKAVDNYKEGQKMAVDVVADMASGMISIVAFGAATALMCPAGALLVAGAVGAISKVGIKAGDAVIGGREYSGKDLLYDGATGGINGLLGPITNGIGNTVTKTIATKFGISVLKEGAEEVAEQGIKQSFKQFAKNVILNQSDDIIGGTLKQRMVALGAGMATDGALGGTADNMVRAGLEGEDILKAGTEGFIGGLFMAPILGGGMKLAGKAGKALNNKITTLRILPDGLNTNFRQGITGDCALLSTIDGIMANPNTANKIKKSITRTAFGDYNVKIGDRIVRVSKDALSDEILSDTTGIKIFEVAYKQMGGSIDGEFAEVVAKQFGLNPIHITSESITDKLLERISKDSDNLVLSFGMDGHYYSIQGIDPQTKMITLVDPFDTSQTLKMSFNEVKTKGASIDGGSVIKTDLPNVARSADEIGLKGLRSNKEIEEKLIINGEEKTFKIIPNSQKGSNPGAIIADKSTGQMYYAKIGNKQSIAEACACDIYRLAGFDVPEMQIFTSAEGVGTVSKFIDGLTNLDETTNTMLFEGYGLDALLANWDVPHSNNAQIKDGRIYRIDFGGTFDYRAKGGIKDFNSYVDELISIKEYSPRYSSMTKEDMIASLEIVDSLDETALKDILTKYNMDDYFDVVLARKKFISDFLSELKKSDSLQLQADKMKKILEIIKENSEKIEYQRKGLDLEDLPEIHIERTFGEQLIPETTLSFKSQDDIIKFLNLNRTDKKIFNRIISNKGNYTYETSQYSFNVTKKPDGTYQLSQLKKIRIESIFDIKK